MCIHFLNEPTVSQSKIWLGRLFQSRMVRGRYECLHASVNKQKHFKEIDWDINLMRLDTDQSYSRFKSLLYNSFHRFIPKKPVPCSLKPPLITSISNDITS